MSKKIEYCYDSIIFLYLLHRIRTPESKSWDQNKKVQINLKEATDCFNGDSLWQEKTS